MIMKKLIISFTLLSCMFFSCSDSKTIEMPNPDPAPPTGEETTAPPTPDPSARTLYNGINLPSTWPPTSSSSSNIYAGMSPWYLKTKPNVINITMGRQLFVDDFLIKETTLSRKWHQAEYHPSNPVLSPQKEWEMLGTRGGGFAAPFSDGVWYDEVDNKFKMWYMGGGKLHGDGNHVTCYAESTDGIIWTRPSLNLVSGTNIVQKGKNRDSNTVWIDKTETNAANRIKMFNVYGGAGNWRYHYATSSDGKAFREQNESGLLADRSTVFHNPFRGVWVYSMRHNVRVDANNLIRGRDYYENASALTGTQYAEANLQKFWFGPWHGSEPENNEAKYRTDKPAIYNLDAIGYESVLLGIFSVWSGPENAVCSADNVIKQNQLLIGYSRDGWSWHREDFTPFCPVSTNKADWNSGNIQSAVGSPIIVGDKLYFYMSGRRLNENNAEITSTGIATLRRDGFASMSGSGELLTEKMKFKGSHFFINANGAVKVEILDENLNVISGFSKDDCIAYNSDSTKASIKWKNRNTLDELEGKNIHVKFYLTNAELFAFWISQKETGTSYGYTAGGGAGYSQYGIDM